MHHPSFGCATVYGRSITAFKPFKRDKMQKKIIIKDICAGARL